MFGLSGLPDSTTSSGGSSSTESGSETGADTAARAGLGSWHWQRTRTGKRVLSVKLAAREELSARARVVRDGKLLGHVRRGGLDKGSHVLRVPVGRHVKSAKAKLRVVVKDASGNTKTLARNVHVPRKLRRVKS